MQATLSTVAEKGGNIFKQEMAAKDQKLAVQISAQNIPDDLVLGTHITLIHPIIHICIMQQCSP